MITVKQAKKKGVVFVEGDGVRNNASHKLSPCDLSSINESISLDHYQVTSFTDRKHTGNKMPCVRSLPVDVKLRNSGAHFGIADNYPWRNIFLDNVISWKPDLEALEKLANEKVNNMNVLKIDWLECDYCINVGYAEVTTKSNNNALLWSGDKVKCPECGISGVIEVELGVAFCVWDKSTNEKGK